MKRLGGVVQIIVGSVAIAECDSAGRRTMQHDLQTGLPELTDNLHSLCASRERQGTLLFGHHAIRTGPAAERHVRLADRDALQIERIAVLEVDPLRRVGIVPVIRAGVVDAVPLRDETVLDIRRGRVSERGKCQRE